MKMLVPLPGWNHTCIIKEVQGMLPLAWATCKRCIQAFAISGDVEHGTCWIVKRSTDRFRAMLSELHCRSVAGSGSPPGEVKGGRLRNIELALFPQCPPFIARTDFPRVIVCV